MHESRAWRSVATGLPSTRHSLQLVEERVELSLADLWEASIAAGRSQIVRRRISTPSSRSRLLYELRDDDVFLVVLGGLVPELLARDDDLIPAHLGTTDVDILLITHVEIEADLGGAERALNRMNFRARPDGGRLEMAGPGRGLAGQARVPM